MRLVSRPGNRVVFSGPIPAGVGDHDYLCGRCGMPVLNQVRQRTACRAVYQCCGCKALNVIPGAPKECCRARFLGWRA
jgi:hypothetical protein